MYIHIFFSSFFEISKRSLRFPEKKNPASWSQLGAVSTSADNIANRVFCGRLDCHIYPYISLLVDKLRHIHIQKIMWNLEDTPRPANHGTGKEKDLFPSPPIYAYAFRIPMHVSSVHNNSRRQQN
jgi:hypothetical protein